MSRLTDEIYAGAKDLYDAGLLSEAELSQFSAHEKFQELERKQKRNAKARAQAEKIHTKNPELRSSAT